MRPDQTAPAAPNQRPEPAGGHRRDRSWPPAPAPLPVAVVDNHSHVDFADGDVEWDIEGLLAKASAVGVERVITIGCELESARFTVDLVASHPTLRGGVSIHPNEARLHARGVDHDGNEMASLHDALAEIDALLRRDGIVTVGETGLDWFRTSRKNDADRIAQEESFRAHIALAKEHELPMQIHDRDAHADVLRILREEGAPERTVLHCFSGDAEMARECVQAGYVLSFAGNLTFKNSRHLREALAVTPLTHVLVETDAPFLTPVPYRGRPNGSYLVPLTMAEIARVKEVPLEDACTAVAATTAAVYGDW